MNIIIVGCGRLGSILANELSDAGHNISVIDRDIEQLNILGSGYNGLKIKGIEYDSEVLQEAGISAADVLLAVSRDENVNITVALIAVRIHKVPRVIARIVNPNRKYIYEKLEIETINPTQLGADLLEARLAVKSPETIAVVGKEYEIAEITANKAKTYSVAEIENKFGCIISAVIKNDDLKIPQKNDLILQGDKFICMIHSKDKKQLISLI